MERRRVKFIPPIRREVVRALNVQAKPVFDLFLIPGKSLESILQDVNGLVREGPIRILYDKIYQSVGASFARDAFRFIKSAGDFETKQDPLELQWEIDMQGIVELETAERVTAVTQTTKDVLSLQIQQSITDGQTLQEASRALRERFNFITRYRSEMIARTEIISASNAGSFKGAESTGLPLDKIWISARDARTRDDHFDSHGQRRDMGQPFNVGGEALRFPGDPRGSAGNVINCRCVPGYVPKNETITL